MNPKSKTFAFSPSLISLVLMAWTATGCLADCPRLVAQFDKAVATKSLDDAKTIEKQIYLDDVCSSKDEEIKDRVVALETRLIEDAKTDTSIRQTALDDLRKPTGWLHSWQTALRIADRLFEQRHLRDAIAFYDKTIALAGDPSAMSDTQKRRVIEKASAAKMLASDDDQGKKEVQFVAASRAPDGSLGGIYSPSMKGVVAVPVPLPINFVYNSTDLTAVGVKAAAELADVLQQQHMSNVTLIGHTDSRGPDAFNVRLSEARVKRVAGFLEQRGLKVRVNIVAKGSHEPFDTSVLPYQPSQDEIWALNRRVELMR